MKRSIKKEAKEAQYDSMNQTKTQFNSDPKIEVEQIPQHVRPNSASSSGRSSSLSHTQRNSFAIKVEQFTPSE